MTRELFRFNGVSGATGEYLLPPQDVAAVVRAARRDKPDDDRRRHMNVAADTHNTASRALPFNVAPEDIARAGWGIVFHRDESIAVKRELDALREHRSKTVVDGTRLKVLDYLPGERPPDWLTRHQVRPGAVTPTKVPYYLLVVGSAERIPFQFTQDLDVEYSVGRLFFETPEEYGRYVQSVIAYERATKITNAKTVAFFGTRHDFDGATQLSADYLVAPLAEQPIEAGGQTVCASTGFRSSTKIGSGASVEHLRELLRGKSENGRPSLLFTATHGVGFPSGDARQRAAQGALLCQDWPAVGQISDTHYLSAVAVPDDANLSGLIGVFFACYGGGTPRYDRFWRGESTGPQQIAPSPFMAALPQRLLAHPGGGALACIGHIERAWATSIAHPDAGPQLQPWQSLLGHILCGKPVGFALRDMNDKYAALSVALADFQDLAPTDPKVDDVTLAETWLDRNDAGGYVLLGDPAAHLRPNALA